MRTHFNSCEHKWLAGQVHVVGRPPCFIKAVKKKKKKKSIHGTRASGTRSSKVRTRPKGTRGNHVRPMGLELSSPGMESRRTELASFSCWPPFLRLTVRIMNQSFPPSCAPLPSPAWPHPWQAILIDWCKWGMLRLGILSLLPLSRTNSLAPTRCLSCKNHGDGLMGQREEKS